MFLLQTNYDACKIIYITNKLIIITMDIKDKLILTIIILSMIIIIVDYTM